MPRSLAPRGQRDLGIVFLEPVAADERDPVAVAGIDQGRGDRVAGLLVVGQHARPVVPLAAFSRTVGWVEQAAGTASWRVAIAA